MEISEDLLSRFVADFETVCKASKTKPVVFSSYAELQKVIRSHKRDSTPEKPKREVDPNTPNAGKKWESADEDLLVGLWDSHTESIESIALKLGRTNWAVFLKVHHLLNTPFEDIYQGNLQRGGTFGDRPPKS